MSKKEKIKELESKLEEAQNEIDAYRQMTIESGLLPEIDEIAPDVKSLKRLEIDLETGARKEVIVNKDEDSDNDVRMALAADKRKISPEELKDIADVKDKEPETSKETKPNKRHVVLPVRFGFLNSYYSDIVNNNTRVMSMGNLIDHEIAQWATLPKCTNINAAKSYIDSVLAINDIAVRMDTAEYILDAIDTSIGFGIGYDRKYVEEKLNELDDYSKDSILWEFKRLLVENFETKNDMGIDKKISIWYTLGQFQRLTMNELMQILSGDSLSNQRGTEMLVA
jgi:hypothetical protein